MPSSFAQPDGFVFETHHVTQDGTAWHVRLGVETYGTLNRARDNAVLVCHYYTGTMHAAGRYADEDATPGWWDDLIGPGKAIDTDRYFVACMNTPSNVQAHDPRVVTTGPDTAAACPAWTLADLQELQLGLMRSLNVDRWHAVLGPSFGGIQALQWAARCPERVARVGVIAASPFAGVVLRDAFGPMLRAVAQHDGVTGALRVISYFGLGADGMHRNFGAGVDFGEYLTSRASTASLAHILDIARVVATHDVRQVLPPEELASRWRRHGVRVLSVNILGDQFFPAGEMRAFSNVTRACGALHEHVEIRSELGHLGCVTDTALFAPHVQALLDAPAI